MNYPIVIHKERKSDYGVSVPDLPGCVSAGATLDEALAMAREAIELHLEGLIEDGGIIPLPTAIEKLHANAEYADGTWAIVHVDETTLRVKIARVGVTMPSVPISTRHSPALLRQWAGRRHEYGRCCQSSHARRWPPPV